MLLVLPIACACNGDDAPADGDGGQERCLDPLPLDCDLTYAATFDAFYDNRIARTCGAAGTGTSCHGPEGEQGGLVLFGADHAYDHLLGYIDDRPRVVPGDPECSLLVQRLESENPDFVMPVGGRLEEGERCAVRRWIASGAER